MKVRFWGTRGSIPCSITAQDVRAKLIAALHGAMGLKLDSEEKIAAYVDGLDFCVNGTFGGHSSCVELETGDGEHVIFDMGSGARPLAESLLARHGPGTPQTYHIFMSHLHWDHIMGFPFFTPIYIPGNRIVIHTCHQKTESAFRRQMAAPNFPVEFSGLNADIEFSLLEPGQAYGIAGFSVTAKKQRHSGDSYGWRLERNGKILVYSTDSEHKTEDLTERLEFIEFFKNADLVIFDAMYSLSDAITMKADWGHSSNILGVELCHGAGVKRLALFHHEPANDDARLDKIFAQSRHYEELTREHCPLDVIAAYDGLEIPL